VQTLRDFIQKINIRAKVTWKEALASRTTFKIGGPADIIVRPCDAESAATLLSAARKEGIDVFVLGGGANILVGDRGLRGIVMDTGGLCATRLDLSTATEEPADNSVILVAGAGLSIDELCLEALARGLGGLEDFYGMPGSVGGSVFMNARCYEREMSQVLSWVSSVDDSGRIVRRIINRDEWAYKRSPYQPGGSAAGELVLEAGFRLTRLDDEGAARTAAVMRTRRADREAKGHYRLPSAGSVFKNDRRFGSPTGKLLDGLGLRGRRIGGAMISPWHANIFVNTGGATAADMRKLIELAQAEAREKLCIELEPEVLMIGEF
jgi:UDP-N-acetylmuramate dehydrogenase